MDIKLGQWSASFTLQRYSKVPQFRKGVHGPDSRKKPFSSNYDDVQNPSKDLGNSLKPCDHPKYIVGLWVQILSRYFYQLDQFVIIRWRNYGSLKRNSKSYVLRFKLINKNQELGLNKSYLRGTEMIFFYAPRRSNYVLKSFLDH